MLLRRLHKHLMWLSWAAVEHLRGNVAKGIPASSGTVALRVFPEGEPIINLEPAEQPSPDEGRGQRLGACRRRPEVVFRQSLEGPRVQP